MIRKLVIAAVVFVGAAFVIQSALSFYGQRMHVSESRSGMHQHYFWNATQPMAVNAGDILIQYVYLDPLNVPRELMLQWHVHDSEGWNHRAFWGEDLINFGDVDLPRTQIGPMPKAGEWIRLEVPANLVNLENKQVDGLAFTLFDGHAAWDYSGKHSPTISPTPMPTPTPAPKSLTLDNGHGAANRRLVKHYKELKLRLERILSFQARFPRFEKHRRNS